ncbi:hypothetical protein BH09MYX1_BH09MYX1_06280 [soil metagenome]
MGDPAEHVAIIERGLVKLARPGAHGTSSIIALFGPNGLIGLTAVIADAKYPADAIVISPTVQIVCVAASEIRAAAATDAAFGSSFQRTLVDHTLVLLSKIEIMSAGSVAQRLATLLVQLGERFGSRAEAEGRTTIPFALTRAILADLVDARVETVIRVFSTWRASNVWSASDDGFEIDCAALSAIALQG